MKKAIPILLLLTKAIVFGQYSLTTIDQAWVDAFQNNPYSEALTDPQKSTRPFSIVDAEAAPSARGYTVVWDMDDHLEASDEGKSVKVVTAGAEWRRQFYGYYHVAPGYPEQDENQLRFEMDPSGRLGIKREMYAGAAPPVIALYFAYSNNELPPDGGYQQGAMSVDMYIPSTFSFYNSTGKFGVGMNVGTRPANGGSTPPEDQLGASTRTVRGTEYEKYHRPYTYALNRSTPHGYQEPGTDDVPVPQGEWVRYEMEIFVNDIGSDNGWLKMWFNGVKFAEYTGLRYRTADQPFLLNTIFLADMWQQDRQGGGTTPPAQNQHYWYSRLRGMLPLGDATWLSDFDDLDFGYAEVSSNTDLNLVLTNNSGVAQTGTVTEDSSHYSIVSGGSFTSLADNATHNVTVRYTPTANGQHAATLTVDGDSGTDLTIPLTGMAATLQAGLTFNADLGTLISPMTDGGTYISTSSANDGFAVYAVDITTGGLYTISTTVDAGSTASNSFFLAMNEATSGVDDIWDIVNLTTGMESRVVSIRGTGSFDVPQFSPATFNLSTGTNYLVIKGRETGTLLQDITLTLQGVAGSTDWVFRKRRSSGSVGVLQ